MSSFKSLSFNHIVVVWKMVVVFSSNNDKTKRYQKHFDHLTHSRRTNTVIDLHFYNHKKFASKRVYHFFSISQTAPQMSAGDSTTTATGFATRLKESAQSAISTRRPWSELLDPTALSLPSSISDATTRLLQNLTHFRFNYSLLLLVVFLLGLLISRPISSTLVFLVVLAAWFFLFFSRDEPLSVAGFVVEDGVVLAAVGIATLVAVVVIGVGWNVVVWVLVGVLVVSLHAVVRSTDDLVTDDRQSPYGPLMSDDHDPQGAYTII